MLNKQCKMKNSATTYSAPGQGMTGLVLATVSYFAAVNKTASQLFNGKLTNAFVWRMAFGTLALTVALVLEGYHISRLWAVVCLLQAAAMMVPAFMEYSLNVKEDEV